MKQFTLYSLFHKNRDDLREIREPEDTTPNLKRFFKLLGRKLWTLVSVNLMMLPIILPVFLAIFLYLGIDKTPSANNPIFAQLYGANMISPSPESGFLMDLFGAQFMIPAYHSTATYVGIGICALFLVVTFGWQNIGIAYILRSLVRGDPVFIFSDYFYAIKRNWKQGFFLGLLDFSIIFLLVFDFMYLWGQTGSFGADLMFWGVSALAILYFFMRFYIYLLQITFHLSIRKILKNALIFTTLGIKRNLMAVLGMAILTAFAVALMALFVMMFGFNGLAIPVILPFFYYLAVNAFMSTYAAYPIIDRYMIAPYQKVEGDDEYEEDEEANAPSSDAE